MQRMAVIVVTWLIAINPGSVLAQSSKLPAVDINCNDFTKQGPDTWLADGGVHLTIDGKDISLNNATIKPGTKTTPTGVDIYALLETMCGGH